MNKTYFRSRRYTVTSEVFTTPTGDCRVQALRSLRLRRPFFWLAAGFALGPVGLIVVFEPYIYPDEKIALLGVPAALLAATWNLGTLSYDSRMQGEGGSTTWWRGTLVRVRSAIRQAWLDSSRNIGSAAGGDDGQDDAGDDA